MKIVENDVKPKDHNKLHAIQPHPLKKKNPFCITIQCSLCFSLTIDQFSVIVARLFNVYPLSFLLNLGRRNKIKASMMHMMMFSGK